MQRKHIKVNTEESDNCRECWCSYICSGECPVIGYLSNGNIYEPDLFTCKIKKELIKISIEFVNDLYNENYQAYKKLVDFANLKFNYMVTDSGLQTILQYLKCKNIHINYSDLCHKVKVGDRGIVPKELVNFIKVYDKKIQAYEFSEVKDLDHIAYPAILLNINNNYYNYYLIEAICKDEKTFKLISDNNKYSVPFDFVMKNKSILIGSLNRID